MFVRVLNILRLNALASKPVYGIYVGISSTHVTGLHKNKNNTNKKILRVSMTIYKNVKSRSTNSRKIHTICAGIKNKNRIKFSI